MQTFSVKLESESVSIENLEDVSEEYKISEMTGDNLEAYFNSQRDKMDIKSDGTVSMKDYKGIYTSLLILTMVGPDDKPVSLTTLKSWPSRVQKALFEIAQRLNGLNVEAKEEAKND